jgi:hypothetical protein
MRNTEARGASSSRNLQRHREDDRAHGVPVGSGTCRRDDRRPTSCVPQVGNLCECQGHERNGLRTLGRGTEGPQIRDERGHRNEPGVSEYADDEGPGQASSGLRGGRCMTSGSPGSIASASAGNISVIRLSHSNCTSFVTYVPIGSDLTTQTCRLGDDPCDAAEQVRDPGPHVQRQCSEPRSSGTQNAQLPHSSSVTARRTSRTRTQIHRLSG